MEANNKVNFQLQQPNIFSQTPEMSLLKWGSKNRVWVPEALVVASHRSVWSQGEFSS